MQEERTIRAMPSGGSFNLQFDPDGIYEDREDVIKCKLIDNFYDILNFSKWNMH